MTIKEQLLFVKQCVKLSQKVSIGYTEKDGKKVQIVLSLEPIEADIPKLPDVCERFAKAEIDRFLYAPPSFNREKLELQRLSAMAYQPPKKVVTDDERVKKLMDVLEPAMKDFFNVFVIRS